METMYTERRFPKTPKFYYSSGGKTGKQKLGNNLGFMVAIKDKWLGKNLGDDAERQLLKKTYFSYLSF